MAHQRPFPSNLFSVVTVFFVTGSPLPDGSQRSPSSTDIKNPGSRMPDHTLKGVFQHISSILSCDCGTSDAYQESVIHSVHLNSHQPIIVSHASQQNLREVDSLCKIAGSLSSDSTCPDGLTVRLHSLFVNPGANFAILLNLQFCLLALALESHTSAIVFGL